MFPLFCGGVFHQKQFPRRRNRNHRLHLRHDSSLSNVIPPTTGREIHPRPISISASGKSGQLRGFEELKPPKDAKIAKQMIFEIASGAIGVDIRALARKDTAASASNKFMKPAGVDEPKETQPPSLSTSKQIPMRGNCYRLE